MDNLQNFVQDETAAETLEWVAVVTATALIMIAVASVVKKVQSKTEGLASHI